MRAELDNNLERLISRVLDHEASAAEHEHLQALCNHDAEARQLYDELCSVDAEVATAMRRALGQPVRLRLRPRRQRTWQYGIVAAAACIATLAWLQPRPQPTTQLGNHPQHQSGLLPSAASWFATPQRPGDVLEPVPEVFVRPGTVTRGTQRHWVVIPGEKPRTYMIVEMDNVRTQVNAIERDF